MKAADILRVKGSALFTVAPDLSLKKAVDLMAEHDVGSVVVMENSIVAGVLTFREVLASFSRAEAGAEKIAVRQIMRGPLSCTLQTELDEVCQMMLDDHIRYMLVMEEQVLMGVISFYDVVKMVWDAQIFENKMLKAFIRGWPETADS